MTAEQGHRQLDHTADLAFELWAPSEEALLVEGARAIIAEITGGAEIRGGATRELELSVVDRGDRLVQWLNEVLIWAIQDGFLFCDAELTLNDGTLGAIARGEAGGADRIEQELKSVTYHDLTIERGDHGTWQAQIIIDV